ncbi:MAG: alpha/beta hydrolase [Candidatus Moranbacteria bacterium]|nr:alpha/beta hydrolase [Candidatus Moranbacteria bacterium]
MSQQIFIVHGGEAHETYEDYLVFLRNYKINLDKVKFGGWKDNLQKTLEEAYEVIYPRMENQHNAKYSEWKIFFELFFPYFRDEIILIGNSLGSIFLAKYLSENDFPVKIKAVFLIAAPYDDKDRSDIDYTLGDFILPDSLDNFSKQVEKIFLYHSADDPVVPFVDLEKYAQKLPSAERVVFKDKGHFNLREFPEFVEKLKSIE